MPNTLFGRRWSATLATLALTALGACSQNADRLMAPAQRLAPSAPSRTTVPLSATSGVVISQVYGGGGNAGSTWKNDFIELHNNGANDVDLSNASVQYASASGVSWQVTNLTGTIGAGQYYLIQEAAQGGGTTSLPSPDAVGAGTGIAMSATAGKVALVASQTALSGGTSGTGNKSCPTGAFIDLVGFGTGSSGATCFEGTAAAPTLTNTTAALRAGNGCTDTDNNGADFASGAPNPRSKTSGGIVSCTPSVVVTLTPANASVQHPATVNYTVSATFGGQPVTITASTWSSSNAGAATIAADPNDPTKAVATTAGAGTTTIGVTVTTQSNGSASGSTSLTVTAPANPPTTVTISPTTWSLKTGQTKAFTATATDAGNNTTTTTYTWNSSNTAVATVDASGVVTAKSVGQTQITATSANNVTSNAATVTVSAGNVSISARPATLPVGFQTQLFVNSGSTDGNGATVDNSNITWSTSDASVVSVNATTGVITANAAGSAIITATANSDHLSAGSTTIATANAPLGAPRLGHNTELGTPTDANPNDDLIIARRQYTLSYNASRGTPNWVSWNLDASHTTGNGTRCNCFTADPALAAYGVHAYDTNDWINGGTWSRGHMSPSADWLDADGDNAPTFYLTNMLPQNQNMNAGSWGTFENFLRTQVGGTNEVYIIAGGIFTHGRTNGQDGYGFLNSAGGPSVHIAIPDSIWKIAVIVPDTRSASAITSTAGLTVYAVNMPNIDTVTTRSATVNSWMPFQTTIAQLQASTGYDFLSALPESVQCRLEGRNCAPVASFTNGAASEGSPVSFDGTSSSDADSDALTYSWTFGDGGTATGATPSHTYVDNGSYNVQLTVSDGKGGSALVSKNVVVANVAPTATLTATTATTVKVGQTVSLAGSGFDPGIKDASWTMTFDFGDGTTSASVVAALPAASRPLMRSKSWTAPGVYHVKLSIKDKDGGVGQSAVIDVTVNP